MWRSSLAARTRTTAKRAEATRRPTRPAPESWPSPRYLFFSGKGGVGKTTCAAATALHLAERGAHVLLISTDPAHSLGDALAVPLGDRATRIPSRAGRLQAVELDADAALARWLNERRGALRLAASRGTYLDDQDIDQFLDLSVPGVDELVGLLELHRRATAARPDVVVVDTAPTGHTLRLLSMPRTLRNLAAIFSGMQEKHRVVTESLRGWWQPDNVDAVVEEMDEHGRALLELLQDPTRCAFRWVALAEPLSVEESIDGVTALRQGGITVEELILNRLTPPTTSRCATCTARRRSEAEAAEVLTARLPNITVRPVLALDDEPRGLNALRKLGRALTTTRPRWEPARSPRATPAPFQRPRHPPTWLGLVFPPRAQLVLFAGKGGVGKTTCAATAALTLCLHQPQRRVLLLSADPAHSLADVLDVPLDDHERPIPGPFPGLRARELDADRAFRVRRERYRHAVDELFDGLLRGSRLDATYDRAVMQDLMDLAPPGIDELFAILSVMDVLVPSATETARYDLVVVDAAPTGHALRLLQMPEVAQEWVRALLAILLKYREVVGLGRLAEDLLELARGLRVLGQLLRQPERTQVIPVTRAAELPLAETERLLQRLHALGMSAPTLLVNAVASGGCPRCRRTGAAQHAHLQRLPSATELRAPQVFPPPRGWEALVSLGAQWSLAPAERLAGRARRAVRER
ncbi:MAG: ArsA family ATPase [Myxococcota bacterium]